MIVPRKPAPLDPQMKAFLEATTDRGTAGVDVFTADVTVLRAQVEAGRIGYADGGPEMARVEELAVAGPGRRILCRRDVPTRARAPTPPACVVPRGAGACN